MVLLFDDVAAYDTQLSLSVMAALDGEMTDAIKTGIEEHLSNYTFPYSRGIGGIADRSNFHSTLEHSGDSYTLTVTDDAPFQTGKSANEAKKEGLTLAEVIEGGNRGFRMPYPRPFMQPTEDDLDAESILEAALTRRGF